MSNNYNAEAQEANENRLAFQSLKASEQLTIGLSAKPKDIENAETISLIEQYLEYNTLGVVYGESGSGKSLLTLSICIYLLEANVIDRINYYDFDNGIADQKNRGIHLLLEKYGDRFVYVNLESLDDADITPPQILDRLSNVGDEGKRPYDKQFFVFDTLGELMGGSLKNDEVVRPVMDRLKKLRDKGATIQVVHHTTKSKEETTFFGSQYIMIKIDALWLLTSKDTPKADEMEFALECKKNRSGNLRDTGFTINPVTHSLDTADFTLASMDSKGADFVATVRNVLFKLKDNISQTDLLEKIGKRKDDKKSIELLKRYANEFWIRFESNSFPKTIKYAILDES